jgi:hypothetical protein
LVYACHDALLVVRKCGPSPTYPCPSKHWFFQDIINQGIIVEIYINRCVVLNAILLYYIGVLDNKVLNFVTIVDFFQI